MGGFPTRPDLASLGPTLVNAGRVLNPNKEATAEQYNLLRWQAAGMGIVSYRAKLVFTANSGAQPILARGEAWNPRGLTTGAYANPTITRIGVGNYDVEYPASVPDMDGESVPLVFEYGFGTVVTPSQTATRRVLVTPLFGVPSGVKVSIRDGADAVSDGNDVVVFIG